MNDRLEFLEWRELPVPYVPARWWDGLRWWLVKRLGGSCPLDTVKVIRVPVDGKTFAERLYKQRRTLFDQFHREAMAIWMGAEDYEELMTSPACREMFTVSSSFNYGREVYGLHVVVVPWMRGTIVMPLRASPSTTGEKK